MGAILFPFSLFICAALYWPLDPLIFQGAALVLGLADGLAGLVGQRFGRRSYYLTGHKTIEGSLTFFGVTIIILIALTWPLGPPDQLFWPVIFFSSLLLTLSEALFSRGWDNLSTPLAAGWLIYIILNLQSTNL